MNSTLFVVLLLALIVLIALVFLYQAGTRRQSVQQGFGDGDVITQIQSKCSLSLPATDSVSSKDLASDPPILIPIEGEIVPAEKILMISAEDPNVYTLRVNFGTFSFNRSEVGTFEPYPGKLSEAHYYIDIPVQGATIRYFWSEKTMRMVEGAYHQVTWIERAV